jgi:F-box and WD-40 domain protein CDC4
MEQPAPGRLLIPALDSDEDIYPSSSEQLSSITRKDSMRHSHPRPPPTPNTGIPPTMPQSVPNPLLPSAPASPPTPAPSPTPLQRSSVWNHSTLDVEDGILKDFRVVFSRLDVKSKEAWLESIIDTCDNHLLSYLHQLVSPKLKKDPFLVLPNELCFKVCKKNT